LLFVSAYGKEIGDSILKKRTRELNINSSLIIPVYYNLRFTDSYNFYYVKPDFKLSGSFGLQYKSKQDILFDYQFQHYQFCYTSPFYGINNGHKYGNQTYYYYDIVNYGQFRNSLGIGKLIKINNKNTIGIVMGLALFTPDRKNIYSSTYTDSGTLITTKNTKNFGGNRSSYCNISYSYSLNKRIALIGDINQSLGLYSGSGSESWPIFRNIWLHNQYFLSINIGAKYILINKLTK